MGKKQIKKRLDKQLLELGLVSSREKAKALIMAGEVLVNQQVVIKADYPVTPEYTIEIKKKFPYVSRGALKIEKALKDFYIDVKGLNILDIGISTGGFTDYMLKNGAQRITGVDVNIQQVDSKLQQHPKLKLIKANARYAQEFTTDQIGFNPDLITIDVSFISVTKILPALSRFSNAKIIMLIKPQFEVGRKDIGKGGVVRKDDKRLEIILNLKQQIMDLDYCIIHFTSAGIKGRKGNQEYFFLLERQDKTSINDETIVEIFNTED